MALEAALLLLSYFLPGYLLVNLIFPSKGSLGGSMDGLYRVFLGVVLSISITMAYGGLLVVVGESLDQVLFQPTTLWPGLAILSFLLFLGGLFRGAYPRISRRLDIGEAPQAAVVEERKDLLDRLMKLGERLEEARRQGDAEEIARLETEKRQLEEEAGGGW